MTEKILLVCTVGGSPEPLIASIKHWRPERIMFFPSHETADNIETKIVPGACQAEVPLTSGCCDTFPVPDHQDFHACTQKIQELHPDIERWLARGQDYSVVFDFTGGTKCMTAALALAARRYTCRFSYVGGIERTKNSVGVVVSGKEQVLHWDNPWNVLGYQAVEEAVLLFDQGHYPSAVEILKKALTKISDPGVKRELASVMGLAETCDSWDRFEHDDAHNKLKNVRKNINDFLALFGVKVKGDLEAWLNRTIPFLNTLGTEKGRPGRTLIQDLLANARRRADEGRWDDAVARLYRVTEAMAQIRLRDGYGIEDTEKVPWEKIPASLQERWNVKNRQGKVSLGLQDDYALLLEMGDELGTCFQNLGWQVSVDTGPEPPDRSSPLVARNKSIYAHGFVPVSDKVFPQLWRGCLKLAGLDENNPDLPPLYKFGQPNGKRS